VTVARHEDDGGGGAPRRWRCSEERHAALMCHASRGRIGGEEGRGQLRVEGLSPVEAVGGVARMKSGAEEGFRRSGTGSTSPSEDGVDWGLRRGAHRKRNGGRSAPFLRSRSTEGEERRGWWGSGAGGTT
jgi:hypothetical protein